MRMHENAWESMRMYENDSYSREGWIIPGWVALYDMPDNEWECMRMAENDWDRLISMEGCGPFHANLHYTTCMRMNENPSDYPIMHEHLMRMHETKWECMRMTHSPEEAGHCMLIYIRLHGWGCMRMTENDWEPLIFKEGWGGGHYRLMYIVRHAWEWMRIHQTIQ